VTVQDVSTGIDFGTLLGGILDGNRCEGPLLLALGRCGKPAEEVDHIYPWSKGGATIVSNGQALFKSHNRSKSNWRR